MRKTEDATGVQFLVVSAEHPKNIFIILPNVDTTARTATSRLPVRVSVVIVLPRIRPSSRFVLQKTIIVSR
jgi:hypothetical protein